MEHLADPREGLGDPKVHRGDPRERLGNPRERLGNPSVWAGLLIQCKVYPIEKGCDQIQTSSL
jgi:hypothetical protein